MRISRHLLTLSVGKPSSFTRTFMKVQRLSKYFLLRARSTSAKQSMKPLFELGPPTQSITCSIVKRCPINLMSAELRLNHTNSVSPTRYLSEYSFAHIIGNGNQILRFPRDDEEVANERSSVFDRGHFGHGHARRCTLEHLSQWYCIRLEKFQVFFHDRRVNAENEKKNHPLVKSQSTKKVMQYILPYSHVLSKRSNCNWTARSSLWNAYALRVSIRQRTNEERLRAIQSL